MRYVEGSDLRTLVRAEQRLDAGARRVHRLPGGRRPRRGARARASSTATSSPPTSCSAADDHAYLTDFGLTKRVTSHTRLHARRRLGRHARLRRARADPRRAPRRARRRLRAGLRALPRARGRAAVPARERRGDAVGPPQRRPAVAARAARPTCRRASTPSSPARMAKDPDDRYPSAGDLGRAALAAAGRPRGADARAPGGDRRGRARRPPGDRRLARPGADRPRRRTRPPRRRLWPWALAAVPIAGLALIAALALGGGGNDGGGNGGGATTAKSTATTTTKPPETWRSRASSSAGGPTTSSWPTTRRGWCAAATTGWR